MGSHLIASLALAAGIVALCIAIYLQFVGEDAPAAYALGYYALGAGILFVLAELSYSYDHGIAIGGLLLILASEVISAYTVMKTHRVPSPMAVLKHIREACHE